MKTFERVLLHLTNGVMLLAVGLVIGVAIAYYTTNPNPLIFIIAGVIIGLILWWIFHDRLLDLPLHKQVYQVIVHGVYMVGMLGVFNGRAGFVHPARAAMGLPDRSKHQGGWD